MPVSKRDKKVSLTKTTKKGMKKKQELVDKIRTDIEKYDHLYVFAAHNMRNSPLKEVREEWKGSRIFFAKKKVMAMALGRTQAEEVQKNLHKLALHLVGDCGLLFTNKPKDHVIQWFSTYSKQDYARSGFITTETVKLSKGPMADFSHAIEPHLRKLGLPTELVKGMVTLREDYTICTEGSKLTPEEASILKLIGKPMAEFKITLICMWSKDGSFEKFKVTKGLSPRSIKTPKKDSNIRKEAQKIENIKTPTVKMDSEPMEMEESPKPVKDQPRRSMRTPKPFKRTPEERQPVKKLTVSAKKTAITPKQVKESGMLRSSVPGDQRRSVENGQVCPSTEFVLKPSLPESGMLRSSVPGDQRRSVEIGQVCPSTEFVLKPSLPGEEKADRAYPKQFIQENHLTNVSPRPLPLTTLSGRPIIKPLRYHQD